MTDVLLVDTTMGNLRSVERALAREGARVTVSGDPDAVRAAERVVVPGQGGFGDFARALEGGLGEALRAHLEADRPYLGICLGMQILFEESDEAPGAKGLGVLGGRVARLPADREDPSEPGRRLKVPHMGWNEVAGHHPLLDDAAWFYFVHSYACEPADPSLVVGTCEYGATICAAVGRGAALACQFHPEKSQEAGARVIRRFLEEAPPWS